MTDDLTWSDWLDYSKEQIAKTPQEPGVYMMHAAMKILYIGNSINLKQTILESLDDNCTKEAKRFRYSVISNHEETKIQLLKEYQEKHDGNLPRCMKSS